MKIAEQDRYLTIKAILLDDNKTIVCGYPYMDPKNSYAFTPEYCDECEDYIPILQEINAATVCHNTRVKIGDEYLYEFDLVEKESLGSKGLYYVEWDDHTKRYKLKGSLNYSGTSDITGNIKIVGNILLNEKDCDRMQKYSDVKDAEYKGPDQAPECRSKQRLNKIARQFLPK